MFRGLAAVLKRRESSGLRKLANRQSSCADAAIPATFVHERNPRKHGIPSSSVVPRLIRFPTNPNRGVNQEQTETNLVSTINTNLWKALPASDGTTKNLCTKTKTKWQTNKQTASKSPRIDNNRDQKPGDVFYLRNLEARLPQQKQQNRQEDEAVKLLQGTNLRTNLRQICCQDIR
jgi:hypothetical protein